MNVHELLKFAAKISLAAGWSAAVAIFLFDFREPDDYAKLERFANPAASLQRVPISPTETFLPNVDEMIERLAARLETAPDDIKGWKMLGWSYFQVARYGEAAAAYARAIRVEPSSAELKKLFDEANSGARKDVSGPPPTGRADNEVPNANAFHPPKSDHTRGNDAEILSMVDRLSDRLRQSPQDLDGWVHLMRSRMVLGDRQAAAKAFTDAMTGLKGNVAASAKVAGVAAELGLKPE